MGRSEVGMLLENDIMPTDSFQFEHFFELTGRGESLFKRRSLFAFCFAHCLQFEHFGDSLRTSVAQSTSPSPVCLSAEGAKNVSGPWRPPLREWGGRKLRYVW